MTHEELEQRVTFLEGQVRECQSLIYAIARLSRIEPEVVVIQSFPMLTSNVNYTMRMLEERIHINEELLKGNSVFTSEEIMDEDTLKRSLEKLDKYRNS